MLLLGGGYRMQWLPRGVQKAVVGPYGAGVSAKARAANNMQGLGGWLCAHVRRSNRNTADPLEPVANAIREYLTGGARFQAHQRASTGGEQCLRVARRAAKPEAPPPVRGVKRTVCAQQRLQERPGARQGQAGQKQGVQGHT